MKMRITGFLVFTLLSISILSYGISDSAFADVHNILPLSISTDLDLYTNGGTVVISGNIKNYDPSSGKGLTYLVISPDNAYAHIGQPTLINPDGSFEDTFVAGGPLWKLSGDYKIKFVYGADSAESMINYVGGEEVISTQPPPPIKDEPEEIPEPPPPIKDEPEEIPEPPPPIKEDPICGDGVELVNGVCEVIVEPKPKPPGGCLIATATYGTELAPQVQFLREIRDNTVMSTESGVAFMTGFNQLYYSFSPIIADMERENPMFQEVVRAFITPMISSLSIMTLAEDGSEVEVLGLGISVIALNLGMYIAAPALIGFKVHNHIKSRK